MDTSQNEALKRELGIRDVALNVVNISIASGIFLLPALVAEKMGSAGIVAYLLCGLLFLLVALCYAEVGSRVTRSGGAYAYIEAAFGAYAGFLANGLLWLGTGVLATAALINGIADMLSAAAPVFSIWAYRVALFAVLFGVLAYIQIRGIRQGMTAVRLVTLVKVAPLLALVLAGIFQIKGAYFDWSARPASAQLGAVAIMLFFAFTGGENALNISGEMKRPQRTAPLGLLLGVTIIVAFYCLIQVVAQGVLGPELRTYTQAPLAAVASRLFGETGFTLLIVCAVLAIFGSLNSLMLVFPRVMYAGALDGILPAGLAAVHPRYATPYRAVVAFTIIAFIMAVSGGFRQLLILATLSILLLHTGVALAAIRFRLRPAPAHPAGFLAPGGVILPILTVFVLLWFLAQSTPAEYQAMAICVAVLSGVYVAREAWRKKHR